jgi:hypothetical protein
LAAVSVVAGVALWQRGVADAERDTARSRELAGAAQGQLASDPELALLLALQGYRTRPTLQAELALRQATRRAVRTLAPEERRQFLPG